MSLEAALLSRAISTLNSLDGENGKTATHITERFMGTSAKLVVSSEKPFEITQKGLSHVLGTSSEWLFLFTIFQ